MSCLRCHLRGCQWLSMLLCQYFEVVFVYCLNTWGCLHFLEETNFCHIFVIVEAHFLPLCEGEPQGVALDLGLFYQNIRHVDTQSMRMGSKDSWLTIYLSIYPSIYLSILSICLSYLSFYPIYLSILSILTALRVCCAVEPILLPSIRSVLLSVDVKLYSLLEL